MSKFYLRVFYFQIVEESHIKHVNLVGVNLLSHLENLLILWTEHRKEVFQWLILSVKKELIKEVDLLNAVYLNKKYRKKYKMVLALETLIEVLDQVVMKIHLNIKNIWIILLILKKEVQ